jgi:hypothetical protein
MSVEKLSIEERAAEAEIERLRARVRELENELAEVSAWANRAVADAQERTYWLDRWQLDLNGLMRHRAADWVRAAARSMRWVSRRARRLQRRLQA